MKKLHLSIIYCLSIVMASNLISCSDDTEEVSEKTKTLAAKPWKETKRESVVTGVAPVDISFTIQACDLDNTIKFNGKGDYEDRVGSTLCFSWEVNTKGSWSWKESESKISMTNDNDLTTIYSLSELSATTMKLELPGGTNEKIVSTFTAQ